MKLHNKFLANNTLTADQAAAACGVEWNIWSYDRRHNRRIKNCVIRTSRFIFLSKNVVDDKTENDEKDWAVKLRAGKINEYEIWEGRVLLDNGNYTKIL
jgi:hypothetical protein